jgi:hypothetical protein
MLPGDHRQAQQFSNTTHHGSVGETFSAAKVQVITGKATSLMLDLSVKQRASAVVGNLTI